jgi:branched-subunit amino acid ABC-type transport system permease component
LIDTLVAILINGLSMGLIYGLIACGFSLVFRMTRVINFAAGDITMLGGMIGYTLYVTLHLPFWVVLIASMLATGLFMVLVDRIALRPAYRRGVLAAVVSTIGLSFFMENGAQIIWGRGGFSFPTVFGNEVIDVGGVRLVPERVAIFLIGLAVTGILTFFLMRTKLGMAARATAGDRETALLMGIDVAQMNSLSFFIAGALGAIAGVLAAPITFLTATMGLPLAVKGFVAALVGGMGNLPGAIAGGIILSLVETTAGTYFDANYREGITFVILIIVLLLRPRGIFGEVGDPA